MMKKNTNFYRNCPYCPHHQPKPCCCKSRKNSVNTKRHSSRTIKNKSIQCIPIPLTSHLPTTNQSTINYSHITALNNNNNSTLLNDNSNRHTLQTISFNENTLLQQKLYQSNKALQQTIIKMDVLSKSNKQLHLQNYQLIQKNNNLSIKYQLIQQQLQKCQKKIKKYSKMQNHQLYSQQIQSLIKTNLQLKETNLTLLHQNKLLNNQLFNQQPNDHNLSPNWIAHTSTKIATLQQNINKLEQENGFMKKKSNFDDDQHQSIIQVKQILNEIMKFVTNQVKRFKSNLNIMKDIDQVSWKQLIKGLLDGIGEWVISAQEGIEKQINRKVINLENKIINLNKKLENMLLLIKNQRLRGKSFEKRKKVNQPESLRCSLSSISNNHF